MENKFKKSPKCKESSFKKKLQKTWASLTEDNIEVTLTTSAIGLMLFAVGIGVSMGISRCITKIEMQSALRKQKKMLTAENESEQ